MPSDRKLLIFAIVLALLILVKKRGLGFADVAGLAAGAG